MSTNLLAATTVTPKVLASTRIGATSATTVYTVPASTTAKIAQGSICNSSASAVNVSLSIVPAGGSVDGTHLVVSTYSLAAGDTLPLLGYIGGAMLGPSDFVSVTVSTINVIVVVLTGVELT